MVASFVLLKVVYMYASCMCNSYRNEEVVQSVDRGPCVCLSTGPHVWKSWECLVYSFQGIKQKY